MATFRVQDAEPLDAVDRHILRLLQADGRRTNVDIAREVGLTPSPCLRRIRSLEERGFISGYSAVLNPVLLRRNLDVVVMVELVDQRQRRGRAVDLGHGDRPVQRDDRGRGDCEQVVVDPDDLAPVRVGRRHRLAVHGVDRRL